MRLPLGSLLTLAAISSGLFEMPYRPARSVPWEPPPEPHPYNGPRDAHVEVKGKRKPTRRERRGGGK